MVTVTAETSVSSTADDAWAALGRRATYASFPGFSPIARSATFHHELDLPIVERHQQTATLSMAKPRGGEHRERRFTVRGEIVSIAGRWQVEPGTNGAGARVILTLDYDIAAPLKTHAVDTLRSRSPLPIRTDADAILSRAVDEFLETRFTEQAAAYCERLREGLQAARRRAARRA
jgi:hypothetical protein